MSAAPDGAGGPPRGTTFAVLGAVLGFLGVAAGAFGAHALKDRLAPSMLSAFETGARYQLVHAVVLVAVAMAMERSASRALGGSAILFVAGIALFSGSLYALALTGVPGWGILTPFGGLCLLSAWLALAVGFARRSAK